MALASDFCNLLVELLLGEKMKTMYDTFSMPESDHAAIQKLRLRCMKLGIDINKSELMRCGLKALEKMKDVELKTITHNLQKIRAGRPPRDQ